MEDLVTLSITMPNGVLGFDSLQTDQTFRCAFDELLGQTLPQIQV